MSDMVNHPAHYEQGMASRPVECIDITRHMPFCLGNAFKYVWRAGRKGGADKAIEDLDKALWYLTDSSEHYEAGSYYMRPAALAAFGLLRSEADPIRYEALDAIVHARDWGAREAVEKMKRSFKNE